VSGAPAGEPAPDASDSPRQGAGPAPWGRDAAKYLLEGEIPVVSTRRHWAVLARPAVRAVPALLLGIWVLQLDPTNRVSSTVGLVVALGALGYLALYVAEWWVRHLLVTRRRVLLTSGVIIRRVAVMPLRRITDLTYQETLVGQLLGYGTFRFESAGQQQGLDVITYIPDADGTYRKLSQLMFPSDQARGSVDADDGTGSSDGGDEPPDPPAGGGGGGGRRPPGVHDTAPIPRVPPEPPRGVRDGDD
jgi:membrane protein YdbS with pleckstrin-like domain